ncbi:hypothetical protein LTS10_006596 [Elasticomyces elasticus]|nr:hypothetical protein LTS10_006596 [Elasticomyces elasticus]
MPPPPSPLQRLEALVPTLKTLLQDARSAMQILCELLKEEVQSDNEILLLHCARMALAYLKKNFDQAVSERDPIKIQKSDSKTKRLYRILMSYATGLKTAISTDRFGGCAVFATTNPDMQEQLVSLKKVRSDIAKFVRDTKRVQPPSYAQMACTATVRPGLKQYCHDHYHDEAGTVVPGDGRSSKPRIIPMVSHITFRDFKYRSMSQPTSDSALRSAIDAMQRTIAMHRQQPYPVSIVVEDVQWTAIVERMNRDPRKTLACVAFYAWAHYKRSVHGFRLGIISPGSTQILWPGGESVRDSFRAEPVYIQAHLAYEDGQPTYRFSGVESVIEFSPMVQDRPPQTVRFLDLPPELRNQIYEHVVEEVPAHKFPEKQPAMALTCRQVNQEVVQLFVQRCGWLVCGRQWCCWIVGEREVGVYAP